MKRWFILTAVIVFLSAAAPVALQYLPQATSKPTPLPVGRAAKERDKTNWADPKAIVEGNKLFDFGTLPQHTTGKHSWVVRNEGKGILELHMISSTCSCTLAKFKDGEKAYVEPGKSTEITLEYETRANNGPYQKGAEIGTNDPDLPQFPLNVKGNVFPALLLYPPLESNGLNVQSLSNEVDDNISRVGIYSKDRPQTKIINATSSDPEHVVVTWETLGPKDLNEIKLKGCERLSINVKGSIPLGLFREVVKVTTDHPLQPEIEITVSGRMTGPISFVDSGRVTMRDRLVDSQKGGTAELRISVREGRETKFEVVSVPKGLEAKVVPMDSSNQKGRYRLVVTVPPGTPAQKIDDQIELRTDHPKASRVFIPVSIWISNSR